MGGYIETAKIMENMRWEIEYSITQIVLFYFKFLYFN